MYRGRYGRQLVSDGEDRSRVSLYYRNYAGRTLEGAGQEPVGNIAGLYIPAI